MEIPRLSPQQVSDRVARGEHVAFVDARSATAIAHATEQVPGSFRVPPDQVERHLAELPRGATIVAYCT